MRFTLPAIALVAFLAGSSAVQAATNSFASPAPQATQLPEIYHSISHPLCSALGSKVLPALGMMMEDDKTIAKGPPFFNEYVNMSVAGSPSGQDMAVNHLESLVGPLVQNTLAIQKLLEDPSVFPSVPQNEDERQLLVIKDQMLQVLAAHQASLDIINGFVQTQQLGELQHEGMGYIGSFTSTGNNQQGGSQPSDSLLPGGPQKDSSGNALEPQGFDNLVLNAGLTPNPYEIDPARIPGLALGYNPISNLKTGLEWTQGQSKNAEAHLSKSAIAAARECSAFQSPAAPSPNP